MIYIRGIDKGSYLDVKNALFLGGNAVGGGIDANNVSIENYGNGWYRFIYSHATSDVDGIEIYAAENQIYSPVTLTGSVLLWGFQLEDLSYATSYIPTLSGASQTRAAETCFGAGTSSTFNSTEGVLYAEISALADDVTNRRIQLSDGTTANRMYISYKNYTNQIRVEIISSSSSVFDATYSAIDITIFSKIALKYKVNDFALWVNGVERQTDNSGSVPSGLSELAFDDGIGNNDFYGNTKDVRVYNEALTDLQLQKLTTL